MIIPTLRKMLRILSISNPIHSITLKELSLSSAVREV